MNQSEGSGAAGGGGASNAASAPSSFGAAGGSATAGVAAAGGGKAQRRVSGNNKSHSRSYPRGVAVDFRKLAGLSLLNYIDYHGSLLRMIVGGLCRKFVYSDLNGFLLFSLQA
jgi:hypothetical protein